MARERPSREVMAARVAGGVKGGKARARLLSPERRSEIARRAAAARWEKTSAGKERELGDPIVVELMCSSSSRRHVNGQNFETGAFFYKTDRAHSIAHRTESVEVDHFKGADILPGRMYRITIEEIEPGG